MGLIDDIVLAPDERLETECAPIENIDRDVKKLADRMLKTMYEADGVGVGLRENGAAYG